MMLKYSDCLDASTEEVYMDMCSVYNYPNTRHKALED